MMEALALALGLMLVFEGLLPLVAPGAWRDLFARLAAQTDGQLRFVGLMFVLAGSVVVLFAYPG
jgi:uncharacterized protein YjeT (DUF2065 family)